MKAVRWIKKSVPYIVVIALLIFAGSYVYGKTQEFDDIKYSSYSTKEEGAKALYLLTGQMGFRVFRHELSAAAFPEGVTMVLLDPEQRLLNKLEMRLIGEWLARGNDMILVSYDSKLLARFEEIVSGKKEELGSEFNVTSYKHGKGSLLFIDDFSQLTNERLKDYRPAAAFIKQLQRLGNQNIYYNEFYHGIGGGKVSSWDIMELAVQLAIIQLVIAAALLLYSLSRRFGAPIVVKEVMKRQENEKIFALSNIFIKARANTVVMEIYLESLQKELAKYLGVPAGSPVEELIVAAQGDPMLQRLDAANVLQKAMDTINQKQKGGRTTMDIVHRMDEIRKVIMT